MWVVYRIAAKHVLGLLAWSTQSTVDDITSNLKIGQCTPYFTNTLVPHMKASLVLYALPVFTLPVFVCRGSTHAWSAKCRGYRHGKSVAFRLHHYKSASEIRFTLGYCERLYHVTQHWLAWMKFFDTPSTFQSHVKIHLTKYYNAVLFFFSFFLLRWLVIFFIQVHHACVLYHLENNHVFTP